MELARDTRMAAAAAVGDEWGVARRQAPFVEHKSHLSQIRTGAALAVFDVRLGGGLGGVAAGVGGGWRMGTVGCSTNRCSRLALWGGDETPGAARVPTASRCQTQSVGTEARGARGCFASRRTRVNWPNFCHFCEADSKVARSTSPKRIGQMTRAAFPVRKFCYADDAVTFIFCKLLFASGAESIPDNPTFSHHDSEYCLLTGSCCCGGCHSYSA